MQQLLRLLGLTICLMVCEGARLGNVKAVVEGGPETNKLPVVLWHGMGDSCCARYVHAHLGVCITAQCTEALHVALIT